MPTLSEIRGGLISGQISRMTFSRNLNVKIVNSRMHNPGQLVVLTQISEFDRPRQAVLTVQGISKINPISGLAGRADNSEFNMITLVSTDDMSRFLRKPGLGDLSCFTAGIFSIMTHFTIKLVMLGKNRLRVSKHESNCCHEGQTFHLRHFHNSGARGFCPAGRRAVPRETGER